MARLGQKSGCGFDSDGENQEISLEPWEDWQDQCLAVCINGKLKIISEKLQ